MEKFNIANDHGRTQKCRFSVFDPKNPNCQNQDQFEYAEFSGDVHFFFF